MENEKLLTLRISAEKWGPKSKFGPSSPLDNRLGFPAHPGSTSRSKKCMHQLVGPAHLNSSLHSNNTSKCAAWRKLRPSCERRWPGGQAHGALGLRLANGAGPPSRTRWRAPTRAFAAGIAAAAAPDGVTSRSFFWRAEAPPVNWGLAGRSEPGGHFDLGTPRRRRRRRRRRRWRWCRQCLRRNCWHT